MRRTQRSDLRDGAGSAATGRRVVAAPAASQLERGLRALELLAEGPRAAADVARELGVNRSTGLRLLQELTALGYVRRAGAGGLFALVPERLYALASSRGGESDWAALLTPVLARLRDESGEATVFGVPAAGSMVYLAFCPSLHAVAVREQLGTARPLHASALGMAYLAALPPEALDAELEQLTFAGGTARAARDAGELRAELAAVAERGYAIDREASIEGVICVAAPVRLHGSLVGAVGFSGPATRFPEPVVAACGARLLAALADVEAAPA